jgi:hypothetical protein
MQNLKQAIKVARVEDGWTWLLLNGDGAPAAAGTAPAQEAAMESAWRAARSFAPASGRVYPDIIVEPAAPADRARGQAAPQAAR